MTYKEATKEAQKTANDTGLDIMVYLDPIGGNEYEEEHWGYGPVESIDILARFREKNHDFVMRPETE